MVRRIWMAGLTLALALSQPVFAVTPTIWRDDTFAEFEKGEMKGVSVTADGNVTLSQSTEEYADTKALHVWSLVRDAQGNLYAGTGNEGKVFRIGPDRKVDLMGALPDARIVHALAVDAGGTVYAGTSPGGMIYRIAPGKSPALVCSTGARYVWALAFTPKGDLYAATGGGGKVLRISPDGKAMEIGTSSDEHIVSLAAGKDGTLYAGTEGNGLVYRIDGGRMQVLYDAPEREARGLAVGKDGTLYVGAMSGAVRLEEGKEEPSRPRPEGASTEERSSLYRISPSGAVLKLWESAQPLLLSALMDGDGRVLLATGDKGLFYRVGDDGAAAVVAWFKEAQPLAVCEGGAGEVFVGMGGAGKVYRLGKGVGPEGTFTSRRYDFGSGARWGKLAWRAETPPGTSVAVQTRSGNTEKSNDGWSGWSPDLKEASGSQVPSPPARFLQYRVRLTSATPGVTPNLREVAVAGLQENLRPTVSSLEVVPPGRRPLEGGPPPQRTPQGGQGGGGASRPSPPASRRGIYTLQWTASDPNGDDLSYTLYVRGADETGWRLIAKDLTTISYPWNTESTPDGTTLIKVEASDRSDNPEPLALTAERVSEPFEVDNTPPRIVSLKALPVGGFQVEGSASDETSPLKSGEYAVDSGDWNAFFPSDGIFDSRTEAFSFKIAGLSGGDHVVLVRVTDVLDNVAVGKVLVRGK
jgi:hypothetical protein